jgi:Dihydroorotase and related cyclic amidohydrolases
MTQLPKTTTLIRNAWVVNEGQVQELDVLIQAGRIEKIGPNLPNTADEVVHAHGRYLLPGLIDDQVHFREPGLTHKRKSQPKVARL